MSISDDLGSLATEDIRDEFSIPIVTGLDIKPSITARYGSLYKRARRVAQLGSPH